MKDNENQSKYFVRKGETVDQILKGSITILQKEKGYRFSVDAVLLAHFIQLRRDDRIIDIGTGSGIISLILASRFSSIKVVGLEIQKDLADMARRSIEMNGLDETVEIRHGDARDVTDMFAAQSFDVAVFNPPYRKLASGRVNPDMQRAIARHEITGSIGDFLAAACYLLKDKGRIYAIYPAKRMAELFSRMKDSAIEPKRARMVHTDISSRAKFVLMEGNKRGGEELHVMPPLYIYDGTGNYTREMAGIFGAITLPVDFSD